MEQKEKQFISYPIEGAESKPVINVGGREYAVMPYMSGVSIPQELFDFVKRHPERDDVDSMIEHAAENLLHDILAYLRDAIAVTAVECGNHDDYREYKLVLPVLMTMDTADRWKSEWTQQRDERICNETIERKEIGKPYVFKTVERNEGGS